MTTGEALKRFRREFKLSQKTVAQTVEVLPQVYSRYENDQRSPTVPLLIKLADEYGVTTDYLLGRSDEPRPKSLPVEDKTFFELVAAGTAILQDALRKATPGNSIQTS